MADTQIIRGLADLYRNLETLPAKIEKNVGRSGIRAGMKVYKEEAAANIARNHSVRTGKMRDKLKVKTAVRDGAVIGRLVSTDFKSYWVEYGTRAHVIAAPAQRFLRIGGIFVKQVMHPGARPKPFIRPALDTRKTEAVVAFANYIKTRLEKKHGLDSPDIMVEGDE